MEKPSLNEIKIVPFLTAIQENNPKLIHKDLSQKQFEDICSEYMESTKQRTSPLQKRVDKYLAKITLINACLVVLEKNIADEEILEVLREQGFKIDRETYFQDIKKVGKELKLLVVKYKAEKEKIPKKAKKKDTDPGNVFDMLTGLSTGLEISLNFDTMVVTEFMSWRSQLKTKAERVKKSNTKMKNGKKR